jgi:CRP-like cAMP-binding protein
MNPYNTPLFKNLSQQDLSFLIKKATAKQVKKNDPIFRQNDPTENLYLLKEGQVKLFNKRAGTQKEEIVCLIEPGDHFCLAPTLTKPTYHINAKATKNSSLVQIPKEAIQELIRTSHTFAQSIIQYLAKKECSTCERNCDLSLSTTKERLAKYLIHQQKKQGNPRTLKLPMTQSQLASHLGTVRETLSRDMAGLKKQGLIKAKGSDIQIADPDQLQAILGKK